MATMSKLSCWKCQRAYPAPDGATHKEYGGCDVCRELCTRLAELEQSRKELDDLLYALQTILEPFDRLEAKRSDDLDAAFNRGVVAGQESMTAPQNPQQSGSPT